MPVSLSFLLALLLRILAGREIHLYNPELGHEALTWFFGAISFFLMLHLLAGTARTRARDGGRTEPIWILPLRSLLPLLPLALYGVTLFAGDWLFWVEVSVDPRLQLTREAFALGPYLWFEVLSLLGALRLHGTPRPSWLRLRKVLAALPLWIAVWIVQDLLLLHPVSRAMLDELPLARPLSMLLTVLVFLPLAPLWVRWLYAQGPLPHPEYGTVLSSIADRMGLRFLRFRTLSEEPEMPGPVVLRGLFSKQVLIPLQEIREYAGSELEVLLASCLHRIKHRMRLRLVLLAMLLPIAFLSLFVMGAASQISAGLQVVVLGAFVFLLVGMLAYFHRRYILEADLATAEQLGDEVCVESLTRLVDSGEDPGPRLFEPGLAERRDFLVEADRNKGLARFFGRATRYSELSLLILVLLSLGITAGGWAHRWNLAVPGYELGLGEISRAERSLEDQLVLSRQDWRAEQAIQFEQDGILIQSAGAWDEYLEGLLLHASFSRQRAGMGGRLLDLSERENSRVRLARLRDLVTRARLLVHAESEEGDLPLLRRRALSRARRALLRGQRASRSGARVANIDGKAERNASFQQAHAWLDLARRWGRDRATIEALQLGLVSRLFNDQQGLRRSQYLLRRLEIPVELDDSIRIVFGS